MEVAKRSLIGGKRKRACAVSAFTFSSLSAIFAHSYRSTIYIMASKEAYLATELDCARGSNLNDSNLAALIADYFAQKRIPMTEMLVSLCVLLTYEVVDSVRLTGPAYTEQ